MRQAQCKKCGEEFDDERGGRYCRKCQPFSRVSSAGGLKGWFMAWSVCFWVSRGSPPIGKWKPETPLIEAVIWTGLGTLLFFAVLWLLDRFDRR